MESARARSRHRRVTRAALSAGAATLTAATAHTLAGGGPPPWWMVLGVLLLALPVAVALVGRSFHPVGVAASVVAAQSLLHVAFASVSSPAAAWPSAGHVHGGGASLSGGLLTAMPAGTAHLHLTPGMVFAHLIAAVATVALLVWGERLARAIVRGWRRLVARVAAVSEAPQPPRTLDGWSPPLLLSVFLSALPTRGPPALLR